jgi:xanthine dehydrogenase accessory factor
VQKIFTELKHQLNNGHDTVFVTVTASHGATPRGAGARMLVGSKGRICGTIGGGAVEYRSEQLAMEAIKNHSSQLKHFELNNKDVENLGMICGGDVTIYFRFISGTDKKMLDLCNVALEQFKEQKTSWLITELTDDSLGEIGIYSEKIGLIGIERNEIIPKIKGFTSNFICGGKHFYAEQLLSSGYVYIFGGGHVAQELVPVLSRVNFRCIVHEDRDEFLAPELFRSAFDIRKVDFENIYDIDEITADDYVVIMTRGHAFDQIIQEQALRTPAKYIGVIGSMAKRESVQASIMSHGFTKEDVARITTPIGLFNVKGETPEEIAISIAGQLITLRTTGEIVQ